MRHLTHCLCVILYHYRLWEWWLLLHASHRYLWSQRHNYWGLRYYLLVLKQWHLLNYTLSGLVGRLAHVLLLLQHLFTPLLTHEVLLAGPGSLDLLGHHGVVDVLLARLKTLKLLELLVYLSIVLLSVLLVVVAGWLDLLHIVLDNCDLFLDGHLLVG